MNNIDAYIKELFSKVNQSGKPLCEHKQNFTKKVIEQAYYFDNIKDEWFSKIYRFKCSPKSCDYLILRNSELIFIEETKIFEETATRKDKLKAINKNTQDFPEKLIDSFLILSSLFGYFGSKMGTCSLRYKYYCICSINETDYKTFENKLKDISRKIEEKVKSNFSIEVRILRAEDFDQVFH